MTGKTDIEWATQSWNVMVGCQRTSDGCDNCYAFTLHDMRHRAYLEGKHLPIQYARPFSEVQLLPHRLHDPLKMKKPQRIFVNSMADIFHRDVPTEFIHEIFSVMNKAHWHTFLILTKRTGRLKRIADTLQWAQNIHMGVSIENDLFVPRAEILRQTPAHVKFLSLEPLLSDLPSLRLHSLDWVIAGGESGSNARECKEEWFYSLLNKCRDANIPFFLKQMGTFWAKQHRVKRDRHGANMASWPEALRIREIPA